MTTRYYEERECEDCGLTHPKGVRGVRIGDEWRVLCEGPGGQRRELTIDYEAALDSLRTMFHPNEYSDGYALEAVTNAVDAAIIPLEEPE